MPSLLDWGVVRPVLFIVWLLVVTTLSAGLILLCYVCRRKEKDCE